jgi:hypothetical protein
MEMDLKNCTHELSPLCLRQTDANNFKGSFCKECRKTYMQSYYRLHRERVLAKANERYVPSGNPRGRPRIIPIVI